MGQLQTIYLGGGTPSLWGSEGASVLERLLEGVNWKRRSDAEITLEVNPGTWTKEGLQSWQDFGVNRASLGVQSLNANFLKVLDRVHSLDEVHRTLDYFQELEMNFSVDFMLGLPFSEKWKRDILGELEEILSFRPTHLSLYILTVPKHYPHFKELPSEEWIEREYLLVSDYLKAKGFHHYEVSNFALEGYESRHNLAYWRNDSVMAMGPSATGYLKEAKLRFKWKTQSPEVVREYLTQEQVELESLYLGLRTNRGLRRDEIPASDEVLSGWLERGVVEKFGEKWRTTSRGMLILDSLMDDLFRSQQHM